MSRLPRPPVLPRPRNDAGLSDVDHAEHDELLRLAWTGREAIARRVFAGALAELETTAQKALRLHGQAIERALVQLRRWGEDETTGRAGAAALKKIATQVERRRTPPPVPAPEPDDIAVAAAELAMPLRDPRSRADRPLGYVDIALSVRVPQEWRVLSGLPAALQDFSFAAQDTAGRIAELAAMPFGPARWTADTVALSLWIDIRPALPPAGLLLRELKEARRLAPEGTRLCVVTASQDVLLGEMLAHEHFAIVTRDWLEEA